MPRLVDKFFDWFDRVAGSAESTPAGAVLIEAGFYVQHTGGGCLAWEKTTKAHYVLITAAGEGDELGADVADPLAAGWYVAIFTHNGQRQSDTTEIAGLAHAIAWCDLALNNPEPLFN